MPALEIVVQSAPGRKISRDIMRLTASAQYLHDAGEHFPDIDLAPATTVFSRWNAFFDACHSSSVRLLG
jgi:hypothetical protein